MATAEGTRPEPHEIRSPIVARQARRERIAWALAGTALLLAAAIAAYFLLQPKKAADVVRFPVLAPENTRFNINGGHLSLSPDGRNLAFVAIGKEGGSTELWLRSLNLLAAEPLPGTDRALWPFWSPDSRYIGFFTEDGKLEKVPISGGSPEMLCDAHNGFGGTWNRDGVILFSSDAKLYRVSDAGGAPTLVAAPDAGSQELFYRFPQFLPDGRHFLSVIAGGPGYVARSYIGVSSLDAPKAERLFDSSSNAIYAPPGYIFFVDKGTLVAQAFDTKALKFTGLPVPIGAGAGMSVGARYGYFSVSENGVMAYQPGTGIVTSQMTWYNRNGEKVGTVGEPGPYSSSALSPDGSRLASGMGENGARDIWIYDLKRGTESRMTIGSEDNHNPVWSPDGKRVMFTSNREGGRDIYEQTANGADDAESILVSKGRLTDVDDLAADGRYVIYDTAGGADSELWLLPLFGEREPFPFVQGTFGARAARFSPDGRHVAYASTETGRSEIYVQTFPEHLGKWQISSNGGSEPAWRHDGKELFYLSPDDKMIAVEVNTGSGEFQAGAPQPLFQAQLVQGPSWRNRYVVSADGQRFLTLTPAGETVINPIIVVLNWPSDLKP